MKSFASFYKYILLMAALFLFLGCKGEGRYGEESGSRQPAETSTTNGFDPLELPQDSRIVPKLVPKSGEVKGSENLIDTTSGKVDSTYTTNSRIITPQLDTLASQALRIQVFATELFGDAKKEHRIAAEIFDQPVYLDYEVPYYKVRVGGFAARKDAEAYLSKAKRAGYSNAWVVAVRVNTKEASPLYEDLPAPKIDTSKGN